MEDTARGPCLRNIGPTRIEHRKIIVSPTRHPCKHLWWSVGIKALDGIENASDHLLSFFNQPIAFHTSRDDAIVLRPDGAELIQIGIIGWILAGNGANPPATAHIFLQQPPS